MFVVVTCDKRCMKTKRTMIHSSEFHKIVRNKEDIRGFTSIITNRLYGRIINSVYAEVSVWSQESRALE